MQVILKHSHFYYENGNEYSKIQGIIDFVNSLINGLYTWEELEANIPECVEIYFMDHYAGQVFNGGLAQYFVNTNFLAQENEQVDIVLNGLKRIHANQNYDILAKSRALLFNLNPELKTKYLENVYNNFAIVEQNDQMLAVHNELSALDHIFYNLNDDGEDIAQLIINHIQNINNLQIVNDDDYEQELEKIILAVPDYEKREIEYFNNLPRHILISQLLCDENDLDFIDVNLIDNGEDLFSEEQIQKNKQENVFIYHISTHQGYFYIIDYDNECILVNGLTNETIDSVIVEAPVKH